MPLSSSRSTRVLLLLLALLPLFAFVYTGLVATIPDQVLNSDLVQPFMLMRDLVNDPSSIASWYLSPAIYAFPDYLIALIVNQLHLGPVFSMIANSAILGVLLALAGGYVLKIAGLGDLTRATLITAIAMIIGFVIGLALPGDLDTRLQVWTMTTFIHSGALLAGVTLVGLWASGEIAAPRKPRLYLVSLVLTAVASYSDLTFLIYVIIPLGLTTGIAWLANPDRGRFIRTLLLAGVGIAAFVFDQLTRNDILLRGNLNFEKNVHKWLNVAGPYLPGNPLFVIFMLATPLMLARALLLTVRALRRHTLRPVEFIEITLAGVQTFAVLTPLLAGTMYDVYNLRYSLPIAFVPVLWLLILGRARLTRPLPLPRPAIWAAGAWSAACGIAGIAAFAALPVLTATPPAVACMDRIGIKTAYAGYWDAKGPVFLSDYRVHMVQINPDGSFYPWNTNERWVTHSVIDGSAITANAINMTGLEEGSIRRIYGDPSRTKTCGDVTFWLYDNDLPLPPDEDDRPST